MVTVRLPEELEREMDRYATARRATKTEVISLALKDYLDRQGTPTDPYDLGADLFGRASSGDRDGSITYKRRFREKLRERRAR